jgi:hypothetical protein
MVTKKKGAFCWEGQFCTLPPTPSLLFVGRGRHDVFMSICFCFRRVEARGIAAEPPSGTKWREGDGADSPTRAPDAPEVRRCEAARPTKIKN